MLGQDALALALVAAALPAAEAKRKLTVSSAEEFWTFFAVVYGLVLLPMIAWVVYSILRDPAAPELARLIWQRLKRRTITFLGNRRAVHHHKPGLRSILRDP